MSIVRRVAAVLALMTLAFAADAGAATLLFVDVPGIPGDSIFAVAENQIQGLSYDFGIAPLKPTKYGTTGVCAGIHEGGLLRVLREEARRRRVAEAVGRGRGGDAVPGRHHQCLPRRPGPG